MALAVVLQAAGVRVNTSPSIPLGLYRTTTAPVEKGRYVIWCPPQADVMAQARDRGYIGPGFCPGGYGYLMKRVLGVGSDLVSIADDGVRVDGVLVPQSVPKPVDGSGRAMPHVRREGLLGEQDLLLMSDSNPNSFDGRYFGPVQRRQVRSVIVPLLTW